MFVSMRMMFRLGRFRRRIKTEGVGQMAPYRRRTGTAQFMVIQVFINACGRMQAEALMMKCMALPWQRIGITQGVSSDQINYIARV